MSNDDGRILRPNNQRINPLPANAAPRVRQNYALMLGLLRDLRAEVQNLLQALQEVQAKADMTNSATRAREILTTIRANQAIYDYNAAQIEHRLRELRDLVRGEAVLYDRYGDELTHIENFWERATYEWPHFTTVQRVAGDDALSEDGLPTGEAALNAADAVLRSAKQVEEYFHSLIYHTGVLTIPDRLNQHLEQLRIGQALDFNATFADEVPREEDRVKILEYLSRRPMAISNGIIDLAHGLVYHAAPSAARRRRSYIYMLLVIIGGGLLAYVVAQLGNYLDDWPIPTGQTADLLIAYVAIMVGGIVHLGIDAIKQARGQESRSTFLAIDDWFTWIHINETGIVVGLLSLWIGYFGLLFINGDINWEVAFFVGYSIDSFVDTFLQRFNNAATARVAKVVV